MRIIAGEFRGRRLLPPGGDQTRPVTDRVKQSVFDIVSHLLPDARVYDVFAGTGSFGLESLSRGAAHAVFYESHFPTIRLLRQNIRTLGVNDRSTVVAQNLFHALRETPARKADIVFLDPPYRFLREKPADLRSLVSSIVEHHLDPAGVIVFRHDAADSLSFPDAPCADERQYGSMTVELLRVG